MVTAEIAMALPVLVLVLGIVWTVHGVVVTRSSSLDAARAAARAAARGDSDAVAGATARRVLPRVTDVAVERAAGLVTVRVSASPGRVLDLLPVSDVVAEVTAHDEDGPP
jgi:Flp pilus assembly protein TadG